VDANVGISKTDVNAGANISPGVNLGSGDQSVSSSVGANQSSTDINSSSTIQQSASSSQSSGAGFGHSDMQLGGNVGSSAEGMARSEASADHPGRGHARGHDEDRAKGLDRADQVAGDHGRHGRDNAREKQGLN
jgi:hypothetical protein